jgi:hypothetical protein
MVRADPEIVKGFHPAAGVAEHEHGLEFLGDSGLDWKSEKAQRK